MSLNAIVAKHFTPDGSQAARPVREALRTDLKAHQHELAVYQVIQVAALLVLIGMAILGLGLDIFGDKRNLRIALMAAAGVSIPTLLAMLGRNIQDWSKTNLFLILVMNSDETEARALLKKYSKG